MTTAKQLAANKANAAISRGPVSAKGKTAAAQNAKKHGLTAPPEWMEVTKWYRIITQDPEARPDQQSASEEDRATLALAEAEASAERARQVETDHLRRMSRPITPPENIEASDALDIEDIGTLDILLAQQLDPMMKGMLRMMRRFSPNRPSELRRTARRLTRYRREAEAQRHKALNRWIILVRNKNETKPNTPLG